MVLVMEVRGFGFQDGGSGVRLPGFCFQGAASAVGAFGDKQV